MGYVRKSDQQKKKAKTYAQYLKEAVNRGQLPKYYLKESKKDTTPIENIENEPEDML